MTHHVLPLEEVVRHIRQQRRMLGISQAQLAKDADTSQSFIAKLEKQRLNPSYEAVRRVLETIEAYAQKEEPRAVDLMQRSTLWVRPGEKVGDALQRMKDHGFSQLPVLDRGRPVGSISEGILLQLIERGEELDALKRGPVRDIMGPGFPTVEPRTRRRVLIEILHDQPMVLVVDGGQVQGVLTKSDLW